MDVAELFDKCLNCYSHEGEFKINEDTITIFRRCSYEDLDHEDEDGNPEWIEGDEAVGAFVNQEEFFGWWSQDRDDLYECMKEVLEWLIANKNLTVTLSVKVKRWPDEDEKKPVRKVKLINILKEELNVEIEQIKNIKVNYDDCEDDLTCKIVNFNSDWRLLYILKGNEIDSDIEAEVAPNDPNKETLENMFKYRYDIL